jgi:hypothetical protein
LGEKRAFFKEAGTESVGRREAAQNDGKQARHVRAGLPWSLRASAGNGALTEVAQLGLIAIPLERQEQRSILLIEKVKSLGQDADNFPRLSVHCDGAPNDGRAPPNFRCQYP